MTEVSITGDAVACVEDDPIPERASAFEWAMRANDWYPCDPNLVNQDALWERTRRGEKLRHEIAGWFAAQFLSAFHAAWKDTPTRLPAAVDVFPDDGDPLGDPDFTLCLFDRDVIADLLRQRQDSGPFIDRLLAAVDGADAAKGLTDDGTSTDKKSLYHRRIAEFRERGGVPPLQKTKDGVQGDREWATENGVSRADITKWRSEILGRQKGGAPKKLGR